MEKPAIDISKAVAILYTNYRGETARRTIIPTTLHYGSTNYHPKPQWLLDAFDVDKDAERTFAMQHIQEWTPADTR